MENTKSTNVGIKKEDYVKSLLISNKTVGQDPRKDYRGWLRSTLFDLLERAKDGDEEAEMFIKTSLNSLILWCDIEDIKINFDPWIWPYIDLLDKHQNTESIDCSPCSVED
jgi:hypothetical protein